MSDCKNKDISFFTFESYYYKNFYNDLTDSYVLNYIAKKKNKHLNAVFKMSLYGDMDNTLVNCFNKIKTKLKILDKHGKA